MTIASYIRRTMYFGKAAKAYKNELYYQSVGYFMLALKHAIGDDRETAKIKEMIAENYLKLKNRNKATQYAQESLKLHQKIYSKNKSAESANAIDRLNRLLASIS